MKNTDAVVLSDKDDGHQ